MNLLAFLKRIFQSGLGSSLQKTNNPFAIKLDKVLSRQSVIKIVNRIFYLGGFPTSESGYESLLKAISNDHFDNFIRAAEYDVRKDNIEVYWIEELGGPSYILILLDPLELFQPEEIMKIVLYDKQPASDLMSQQVYRRT